MISIFEINHRGTFKGIDQKIIDSFWKFHSENPRVIQLLLHYARMAKNSGRSNYGIKAICERVRWHEEIDTVGDPFKLNNNLMSCYARALMTVDKELTGFFQTRSHKGAVHAGESGQANRASASSRTSEKSEGRDHYDGKQSPIGNDLV